VTAPRGRGERVLVVAKAPAPGRTKTRLCPPLSPDEAATLGRAMLLDTLETCRAECNDVGILYAYRHEAEALRDLAGPSARLVLQDGHGLTDALRSGSLTALADADAVALVSSDIPGVPAGSLRRAFAELGDGADVVLGPGLDGGYWLVALRAPHAAPFADIPWSTPDVLDVTRERCAAAGLAVALLPPWRDVDTAGDLAALLADRDGLPGRRSAATLDRLLQAGRMSTPALDRRRAGEAPALAVATTSSRDDRQHDPTQHTQEVHSR
jgi:rSAM/selenodomain-associated transferase 1